MTDLSDTDGMLREWGTRLFHPAPRKSGKASEDAPPLMVVWRALSPQQVREQVHATVAPGARQVMVKITGGGRGMLAVGAHMRYISRQGRPEVGGRGESLELEDEAGSTIRGSEEIAALRDEWRVAGSYIPDDSPRREAFNIILSMPEGTPPEAVRDAARDFAHETFEGHKYVFVLHEDTASPHVHLTVRAERGDGVRLNPRKADLAAWRARFAARLQDRGIDAVATRAVVRGRGPRTQSVWRVHAVSQGRERRSIQRGTVSARAAGTRQAVLESWKGLATALALSKQPDDRSLANQVLRFVERAFGGQARALPGHVGQTRTSERRQDDTLRPPKPRGGPER